MKWTINLFHSIFGDFQTIPYLLDAFRQSRTSTKFAVDMRMWILCIKKHSVSDSYAEKGNR
ncbi:hypothetical protein KSI01_28020 [Kurthia sibirica]|nr:hypothetical protein KSI01_28020 [Kurthia sibirica]